METYISKSFIDTQRIGKDFAKRIKKGTVLALYGDLGSGKTTFVQGLAKGLGVEKRIISPTFVIVRSYEIPQSRYSSSEAKPSREVDSGQARMTISSRQAPTIYFYHIDLYRVERQQDLGGLGIEEILNDPENIVAIEWAEKMKDLLPKERIDIKFEYVGEEKRKIIIHGRTS